MAKDKYLPKIVKQIETLCSIPSPVGFTHRIVDYLASEFRRLAVPTRRSTKDTLVADLGGQGNPLALLAHVDTLGAMVRNITSTGRLKITRIGTYPENYIETENSLIHTRDGKTYSGTCQIINPSYHANKEIAKKPRDEEQMEIVIDEKVKTKDQVLKLGIRNGDFISFDPRTRVTGSGFIKSRHLDDKASAGILLAVAEYLKAEGLALKRKLYLGFTVYEEVGHGAASGIPREVQEIISVDMGVVGEGIDTDEYKVSICAKDTKGPYDYDLTNRLIETAKGLKLDYAVDVYPYYGSDADVALRAGYDVKHALIGPGVYASHGYERTHKEALSNTFRLITGFLER